MLITVKKSVSKNQMLMSEFLPEAQKSQFLCMLSENVAKITINLQISITSCEILDSADNPGYRFWNIFMGLVILRMHRQLHDL